ncbi:MAG: aldehyde dehydrogenase family protein [Bdellovibrionales bacterium]|nr:aldehyde dehydrogenase family protein [Bdellovibrionales bacterium]
MKTYFSTINPTTEKTLEKFKYATESEVQSLMKRSQAAFERWSHTSLQDRQEHMLALAQQLLKNKEALSRSMTHEMGKPIVQSQAEVEKCIQLIEFCVEESKTALAIKKHKGFEIHSAPQGIIFGIMPWNFPLWQVFRFAIPTMLAGNCVVVKHAENVAGTSLLIEDVFRKARMNDVYTNILVDHQGAAELIGSPMIRGVSLTGSTRAGKSVAETAGKHLKKVVLELGGNDAYIVCEDANLELAAQKMFQARILNAGQSCISAKRLIIHRQVIQPVTDLLIDQMEKLKVGDPLLNTTEMGPVARKDLLEGLLQQLDQMMKLGAQVKYTHPTLLTKGFFLTPTIVHQDPSIAFNEEVFGPIFTLIPFENDPDAIQIANSTPYGLGGAVFSGDSHRAYSIAQSMDTGSVAVNDFFRSSPERPFGGVKDSGYGRELGEEGFYEFVNKKVIVKK